MSAAVKTLDQQRRERIAVIGWEIRRLMGSLSIKDGVQIDKLHAERRRLRKQINTQMRLF